MKSDQIKTGIEKAPHRALLKSLGLNDDDMTKPFIGVANSYTNIVPGHIHLRQIGEAVKEGILAAGGIPFEFSTIAVCDGIAMGHIGMRYSLPSREIVADSVESCSAHTASTESSWSLTATKSLPACLWQQHELTSPPS